MIYTDCHLHTSFSGDCNTPMEEQIEQALRLGLKTLCFTDHFDPDFPEKYGDDFSLDTESYHTYYLKMKEQYAGRIELLFGVEYGLQPHLTEHFTEYIRKWPFDFIIGSSHLLYGDDPYYLDPATAAADEILYHDYLEEILKNMKLFDGFQSYGHLDYVVRYGRRQAESYQIKDHMDVIDEILRTSVDKGIAIEVNTAGLKYGIGFAHPHPEILKRYRELGGELLTIGSDSHAPQHLAYSFDTLSEYLKSLGFRYYTLFRERKPDFIPID